MKRSVFLKTSLSLIPMITLPFGLSARRRRKDPGKGFMVGAGKDRSGKGTAPFQGDTFFTKVSTQDTDGSIYVFESTRLKPGGPSLHYHYEQDEWWYVLEGEFLIKVGEETYHVKAGDSVFGPRMVPHTFTKLGNDEAKLLMFFQPAGKMEAFFKAASEGVFKSMTETEQDAFRKAHGFERVGQGIGPVKQ